MRVLTRATAVLATLVIGGCGSTTPSAPSSVPGQPGQYPSLVGHWANAAGSGLVIQYRDTGTGNGWNCAATLDVLSQTGGSLSGSAGVKGTGASEPPCTFSFDFMAEMNPDGTITSFRIGDRPFVIGGCTPVSVASIRGAVTNSDMRIIITDHATCQIFSGSPRDADRTLTISVTRR